MFNRRSSFYIALSRCREVEIQTVLIGIPVDVRNLLTLHVPVVWVAYDIEEIGQSTLAAIMPVMMQRTGIRWCSNMPTCPGHLGRSPDTLSPSSCPIPVYGPHSGAFSCWQVFCMQDHAAWARDAHRRCGDAGRESAR